MIEIWKPMRNFEEYLHISNMGNVKLLKRKVPCGKGIKVIPERMLIPIVTKDKYKYGIVSFGLEKKTHSLVIGRAVYETFNDVDLDNKKVIVHIDGDNLNNRLENIKIITRRTIKTIRANKTGVVGVKKHKDCYEATIVFEGKRFSLYSSTNKNECHKIYQLAKSMFDEFDMLKAEILNNSKLQNKLIEKEVKLIL